MSSRRTCWSDTFRYSGEKNVTSSNLSCQKWQSSYPHVPRHRPLDASADLDHNYCRNPDGDANGPWCYTTNPAIRFQYCDVPNCNIHPSTSIPTENKMSSEGAECFSGKLGEYDIVRGDNRIKQTKSGLECQRWDSNTPHKPKLGVCHQLEVFEPKVRNEVTDKKASVNLR